MKHLLAALLAMAVSAPAWSVSLKVGYGLVPAEDRFQITDDSVVAGTERNGSASTSFGVLMIGSEVMGKVTDSISLGVEVGCGLPMGEYKMDAVRGYVPVVGDVNKFDGDSTTIRLATIPILARAEYAMKAGPGTASLGLATGAVLMGVTAESVDVLWWNGNNTNSIGADKTATKTEQAGTKTTNNTVLLWAYTVNIVPAYRYSLTEEHSLGIEVPLSLMSVAHANRVEEDITPVVPDKEDEDSGIELGGFGFGVNLVYTRKF